jgi:hypothetical protein
VQIRRRGENAGWVILLTSEVPPSPLPCFLEVLIIKDFKSFVLEVLIIKEFKSFVSEVLIIGGLKSF